MALFLYNLPLSLSQETEDLLELQTKEWDPILNWFNQKFEVDIKPCPGLLGADIPASARNTIRQYLLSYDEWAANGEGAKVLSKRMSLECQYIKKAGNKEANLLFHTLMGCVQNKIDIILNYSF